MKHLLGIAELDRAGIEEILDSAESFLEVTQREIAKVPALRGRTVASVFYEDSTRTRLSFEGAAKRLSADTLTFSLKASSVSKGESLRDTAKTIEGMGADAMVVRHPSAGAPHRVATWVDAAVVNAGDGWHEHPTQALVDVFTLRRRLGPDLDGVHVGIVGDVNHSRVARSNTLALAALGARVTLVGPATLMPPSLDGWPVESSPDLDAVLGDLDVVYLLRLQRERQGEALFPSLREYTSRWGLTAERAARLPADAVVMHPGPMNRGIEIAHGVADGPASLVGEQVANGIAVRMAVLYRALGSTEEAAA